MSHEGVRARWGIIALIVAGLSAIISALSYETALFGMRVPVNPPVVVNPGPNGFVKAYIYYPHYFGPPFFLAAVILAVVGLVLIFRFKGKSNNREG